MPYEIDIANAVERPTAVIEETSAFEQLPSTIQRLIDDVYAFVADGTIRPAGQNIVLYRGEEPEMVVEVGIEVEGHFEPRGRLVPSRLPSGRVARTSHRGPYRELVVAHRAVRDWCAEHGHALAGPRWETYGDWSDDPAKLETEVRYLLT